MPKHVCFQMPLLANHLQFYAQVLFFFYWNLKPCIFVFGFYIWIYKILWLNFCQKCKNYVHIFAYEYANDSCHMVPENLSCPQYPSPREETFPGVGVLSTCCLFCFHSSMYYAGDNRACLLQPMGGFTAHVESSKTVNFFFSWFFFFCLLLYYLYYILSINILKSDFSFLNL